MRFYAAYLFPDGSDYKPTQEVPARPGVSVRMFEPEYFEAATQDEAAQEARRRYEATVWPPLQMEDGTEVPFQLGTPQRMILFTDDGNGGRLGPPAIVPY
jgi:hypothetical protein